MDFWNRMIINIADAVRPTDLDDDTLFLQMNEALQEEQAIWDSQQDFIDPCVIKSFRDKW